MQFNWRTTHVAFDDGIIVVLNDAAEYHNDNLGVQVELCRDVLNCGISIWQTAKSFRWSDSGLLARISEGWRNESILWEDIEEIQKRQSHIKQKGKCIDCGHSERQEMSLRCYDCKTKPSMVTID